MGTTLAVVNIVLAVVAVGAQIASGVIARRRLDNATKPPELRKHPTADEGNAAAWVFGQFNRVSGQVIYLSKIQLVKVPGEDKGKSEQTVVWNYTCNVAIAWCRNECDPENPVRRIWASGELIFDALRTFTVILPNVNIVKDQQWDPLPGPHQPVLPGSTTCFPAGTLKARKRVTNRKMQLHFNVLEGSQEDNDLIVLKALSTTLPITITGAANAVNNGTFTITHYYNDRVDPLTPGQIQWIVYLVTCVYIYPDPVAPTAELNCTPFNTSCVTAITENGASLTVVVTVLGFSLYYPPGGITHYPGDSVQAVDPTIALDPRIGPNEQPAFRGTCYTVIKDFDITKWASTLPHFEAEVRTTTTQQFVKDAFDAVLARNEATTEYKTNTSELASLVFPVFGLQVLGPVPPGDTLNMLMQVYDVEAQERLVRFGLGLDPENMLFFVPRDDIPVNIIDYDLTSSREVGSDGRVHAIVKRTTQDDLPNEFVLDYTEFERDLQPGTTSFTVSTGGVRNTQKLTIPLVQTQPAADVLCRTMLYKAIRFHDKIEFNLPAKEYGITEGDRLRLETPSDGLPIEARVVRIDIGENGLLDIECEIDDDLAYDQLEGGGYSDPDDSTVVVPDIGQLVVMDIAPLASSETLRFGLYLANSILEIVGSTNYTVFTSLDKITWNQTLILQAAAIAGSAITVLAAPDDVHAMDFANTVTIRLNSTSTLESVLREDVESGLNWAFLGGEIIGFMTATLVGPSNPLEYVLSGLLRGRNDSEEFMDIHVEFETFVLLPPSSQAVAFIELEPSLFASALHLAIAPAGIPVEDAIQITVTPTAETLRPYSVHGVWGFKRPTGAICVFATSRTRVPFRLLSALVPPFVETGPITDYVADVYWLNTPTTWEFLRTIEACDAPNNQMGFDYDQDMQTVDLVDSGKIPTPDITIRFRFIIFRLSDSIGPGREVEFCIENVGSEFVGSCFIAP